MPNDKQKRYTINNKNHLFTWTRGLLLLSGRPNRRHKQICCESAYHLYSPRTYVSSLLCILLLPLYNCGLCCLLSNCSLGISLLHLPRSFPHTVTRCTKQLRLRYLAKSLQGWAIQISRGVGIWILSKAYQIPITANNVYAHFTVFIDYPKAINLCGWSSLHIPICHSYIVLCYFPAFVINECFYIYMHYFTMGTYELTSA